MVIRDYFEQLHANKVKNLKDMDKFLEVYSLPLLICEENRKTKQAYS